jgi:polyphosphate glucokinase
MATLGIDVGGTGVKAALVDTDAGTLVSDRVRVPTPERSTPDAVAVATANLVSDLESDGPVGVGVPAVVVGGRSLTAANIDAAWIGADAAAAFRAALTREVVMVNDADAAGVAEMRFGAGRDQRGVVLILTLGTGIGSALFVDGTLVPNTELGHLEFRGQVAETKAAASAREREQLTWERWARRLSRYLQHVDRLLWPDLIILGGGVSRKSDKWISRLDCRPRVAVAELENAAGIVGAAVAAAESA